MFWEQGVAGSNPATPTNIKSLINSKLMRLLIFEARRNCYKYHNSFCVLWVQFYVHSF